ncbi:hypothetical protein V6N13_106780 [Hibiscus sabdariffa]|uniref:Uncharacterized protein n=1 Tax=Hibiscus sabdariffa TaxID=183260 RepID=A0ABR2F1T3_9ROSI
MTPSVVAVSYTVSTHVFPVCSRFNPNVRSLSVVVVCELAILNLSVPFSCVEPSLAPPLRFLTSFESKLSSLLDLLLIFLSSLSSPSDLGDS